MAVDFRVATCSVFVLSWTINLVVSSPPYYQGDLEDKTQSIFEKILLLRKNPALDELDFLT